ncbi:DeoR/GlpR family DNA-binding transcription regulator [Corynebacterium accolens]|uniref:DeoR/GlpR family DNA-binding transcription regulator n=1 Tax=Corynebacterium accolens TaxID=38284 RepID=UPI00266F61C9|nr:DeoR/GlpR family DNA-binding transcription regulator [Corynebacterium accolens]WKS67138.1 DeoR/GlpR family DNA-binding transcription regulator [Corynebacterium accolens]
MEIWNFTNLMMFYLLNHVENGESLLIISTCNVNFFGRGERDYVEKMGARARRAGILDTLRVEKSVRTESLAERFNVSAMTIHRDLAELEASGKLSRVWGGARSVDSDFIERDVAIRRTTNKEIKTALAKEVRSLVEPGEIIALDDSTTAEACLRSLLETKPAGVITHSLHIMHEVSKVAPEVTLTGVGGRYVAATDSFLGNSSVRALKSLNATVSIVSTTCITKAGLCHPDEDAAVTKTAFLELGARQILVSDSSKFANSGMYFVAKLTDFDHIVMDMNTTEEQRQQLESSGAQLHWVETPKPEPTVPTPFLLS